MRQANTQHRIQGLDIVWRAVDPDLLFIESGSGYGPGSSISIESGSKVLIIKNWRKKIWLKFFFLQFFLNPKLRFTQVQATGEAFSPQKRTSSTKKNEIYWLFPMFVCHFCPPGSGSRLRIRIQRPHWILILSGSGSTTLIVLERVTAKPYKPLAYLGGQGFLKLHSSQKLFLFIREPLVLLGRGPLRQKIKLIQEA